MTIVNPLDLVSPVIRRFCTSWNDSLNDTDRDRLLKPFITKVIGTNTGTADDETRAWMCVDFQARVHSPAWLRLAGLHALADELAALPEITDSASASSAQPVLDRARSEAAAARDAAYAARAAWDVAYAARAARDAARDAAAYAARAAWDVAYAARAARAAWDVAYAARAAARAALAGTVTELQAKAVELLDRMCAVGR